MLKTIVNDQTARKRKTKAGTAFPCVNFSRSQEAPSEIKSGVVTLRSVRSGKYLHIPEEHQGDRQPVWQCGNGDCPGSHWQVVQSPGTRRFHRKAHFPPVKAEEKK